MNLYITFVKSIEIKESYLLLGADVKVEVAGVDTAQLNIRIV